MPRSFPAYTDIPRPPFQPYKTCTITKQPQECLDQAPNSKLQPPQSGKPAQRERERAREVGGTAHLSVPPAWVPLLRSTRVTVQPVPSSSPALAKYGHI